MCVISILKGAEREKGTEEIFEVLKAENFPKIKDRHQSTDPGSSQHNKQDKYPPKKPLKQKAILKYVIFKLKKINNKEKTLKEVLKYCKVFNTWVRGKGIPYLQTKKVKDNIRFLSRNCARIKQDEILSVERKKISI